MKREMQPSGRELKFEHVGEFQLEHDLVIADPHYLSSSFAAMQANGVRMSVSAKVIPGTWHILVVHEAQRPEHTDFLILCHDDELAATDPMMDAEAIGMLRIDSGKVVALDAELRDQLDIQQAVEEADPTTLPGTVVDRGATAALEPRSIYTVYASTQRPRSSIFLAAEGDEPKRGRD